MYSVPKLIYATPQGHAQVLSSTLDLSHAFSKVCIGSCKFQNINVAGKKWKQERGREEGSGSESTLEGGVQLSTWCHMDCLTSASVSSKMTDELWFPLT